MPVVSELMLGDDPPPPRGRPRWVDGLGLAAIVLGMVAIGVLGDRDGSDDRRREGATTTTSLRPPRRIPYASTTTTTITRPSPMTLGPVHHTETGTVLLLQEERRVQLLDVDAGVLRTLPSAEEGFFGSASFGVPGGFLIGGRRGGLEVLPVDGSKARPLSDDLPDGGWPVGVTSTAVWAMWERELVEIDFEGRTTGRRRQLPETAYPAAVLDRGFVVAQFDSLTLVEHDGQVRPLGHGTFWGASEDAVVLVTCEQLRCRLRIVDPATGRERSVAGLDDLGHLDDRGRFSGDGRWFAYKSLHAGTTEVVVVDLVAARATALEDGQGIGSFAFAHQGDALFAVHGNALRLYEPGTGTWTGVDGVQTAGVASISTTSRG